jgi:hypothetical protein
VRNELNDKMETSGAALITYAIASGIRQHMLPNTYISMVNKAWRGIVCSAIHPDGTLGYVQTSADNPNSGTRDENSTSNFGVGAVLLAGSEIYHLAREERTLVPFPSCFWEAEEANVNRGQVENEHSGFSGTGYINYDNVQDSYVEWQDLGFRITPQAYALAFRYALGAASQDRRMDISVNNTVIDPSLSFPFTGCWSCWTVQTTTAVLRDGDTIKAQAVTSQGGPNVDYLDLVPVIEAETTSTLDGIVESEHAGYTGSGYVNFYNDNRSSAAWTVQAAQAGFYITTFRYANGSNTDRAMTLSVNGQNTGNPVSFPSTQNWTTWKRQRVMIPLNKGDNTLRVTSTINEGGPNIDHIGLSFEGS